ncbi:MAG: hypothetical protein J6T70_13420 [Bacteroidales bacterium]|nr:hypothetical protein [Bacteroidales bacterium]
MSKFIKVFSIKNEILLFLNRDLIESVSIDSAHWIDFVMTNCMYKITNSPFDEDDTIIEGGDTLPEYINDVTYIKRIDLATGDESVLYDYHEQNR